MKKLYTSALLVLVIGLFSIEKVNAQDALQFDGTNDYVTFGAGTSTLGAATFTLECWFNWTGGGVTASTGTGGIIAYPLITKGRGEADGDTRDMNYFLGITAGGVLAADFEDIDATTIDGDAAGQNQPITGAITITPNEWHHAAATFDGTYWRLYLDGILDNTVNVTNSGYTPPRPQFNSIQHAGIGTAMTSTGAASGYFQGVIDEVRIWNYARSRAEIQSTIYYETETATGLLGRWGLNDGTGTTALNSISGSPNGSLRNGPVWVTSSFVIPAPPLAPSGLTVEAVSCGQINLSWTDNSTDETGFEIERSASGSAGTYTVVANTQSNVTTWSDFNLVPSTEYYYRVRAIINSIASDYAGPVNATTHPEGDYAVYFNGSNQYVTFGPATDELGTTNFTLEAWVRRSSGGVAIETGAGGLGTGSYPMVYPVITKGRGEVETPLNRNTNYFLGIAETGVIAADFEDATDGTNHPAIGVTSIPLDEWHHIAVTYDGQTWRFYLDGMLDNTVALTSPFAPENESIQHAAIATALNSSGVASGYFSGTIDEARIWDVVRTQEAIRASLTQEITSGTGLRGRWGLNEGTSDPYVGYTSNSVPSSAYGTLINNPIWVTPGSPFEIVQNNSSAFRQGVNGYSGASDTYIEAAYPDKANGMEDHLHWDGSPEEWAFLRFDNIFGSGPDQIPAGSEITSATLTYVQDDVGDDADLNEISVTWDGNTTYNTFGNTPGVQADDYGNLAGTTTGSSTAGTKTVDVTSCLSAWSADPSSNNGWIFRYRGTSGVQFLSSDNVTVSSRPALQVQFITAVTAPPAAPSGLVAGATAGTQILLGWNDNSNNEAGFRIERSVSGSGGTYLVVATVGANVNEYSDSGLDLNTEYCYRVYSFNALGNSSASDYSCATTPVAANNALQLNGSSTYVSFGAAPGLATQTFTIETWFMKTGPGTASTTGTDGIDIIPLVAKGAPQADGDNRDANYVLGIQSGIHVIAADFEEGTGSADPGQNHPLTGTTVLQDNVWYHAAVTYDASGEYRLYLNGRLEASLSLGSAVWPQGASIQHSAIGTMLESDGTSNGLYQGASDEVRIWNYARNQSEIQSTVNLQLADAQAGLIARWAMDEGTGTVINGSAGTAFTGNVTGTAYQWIPGAPFNINFAPGMPGLVAPPDDASNVTTSPKLNVSVSDPESGSLTVSFYGREASEAQPGEDFTIVSLPDAQNYTAGLSGGTMAMFTSQTNWCVNQRVARNIAYVAMEGDITNDNNAVQWANGVTAMSILEDPVTTGLPYGLPYGIAIGNHDGAPGNTALYNSSFGYSRFEGRSYYGGHYGSDNNNNYSLFRAGGMDFIVINLGAGTTTPTADQFDWANGLLETYSDRRAIVVSHNLLASGDLNTPDRAWNGPGQEIYNALRGNSNLFLMLCGHLDTEGIRDDDYNDNTVYTVLSDYQGKTNGGSGWLRIFTFSPENNTITVSSYSPYLNQWNWNGNQPVVLPYAMSATNPFELIGTVEGVASGSQAEMIWNDLDGGAEYDWYVTVSDGQNTVTSPVWSFTTLTPAVWTGAGADQNWNTTENWSSGSVPTSGEVVIGDVANDPVVYDATSCGNLIIRSGGQLRVMPAATFSVMGDLVTGGSLTIESDASNSGSLFVSGTSTGNVTYNRYMRNDDRHFFSSPVGGSISTFETAHSVEVFEWDEILGVWDPVLTETDFVRGKGYAWDQNAPSPRTVAFTGTIVKTAGPIMATAPYSDPYVQTRGTWGGGGWNLLGNPFTSAMSAVSFIEANGGNMDPNYLALYIYDGPTMTYRWAASTSPGYPLAGQLGPAIQAGQGFFVLTKHNDLPFTFASGMQAYSPGIPMLKSSDSEKPWPGLQLKVKYGEKESSTLIVYNNETTAGLDPGFDIGQLSTGPRVEIYTALVEKDNSVNFAQQALPLRDCNKNTIPVGIDSEAGGEVVFSAYTVPLGNNRFWLEDRTTGVFTDLTLNSYTVTLPANTYGTGRFFIYASANTPTSVGKPVADDAGVRIWSSAGMVIIKGEVGEKATCELFDMNGEKIQETQLEGGEMNTVAVPTGRSGVFLVRVVDGVKTHIRKVIIL